MSAHELVKEALSLSVPFELATRLLHEVVEVSAGFSWILGRAGSLPRKSPKGANTDSSHTANSCKRHCSLLTAVLPARNQEVLPSCSVPFPQQPLTMHVLHQSLRRKSLRGFPSHGSMSLLDSSKRRPAFQHEIAKGTDNSATLHHMQQTCRKGENFELPREVKEAPLLDTTLLYPSVCASAACSNVATAQEMTPGKLSASHVLFHDWLLRC